MKEYILIFRGGEDPRMHESPESMEIYMLRWKRWIEQIYLQGKYISGQPLTRSGKVVQGRERQQTDGPFAEGKEVVGGYLLIRSKDLEEAVEISRGCPGYEFDGSVEVREVLTVQH